MRGGKFPVSAAVLEEAKQQLSALLLLALVLLIIYIPRLREDQVAYLRSVWFRVGGIVAIFGLLWYFGWTYAIVAALAYTLLLSRVSVNVDSFQIYGPQGEGEGFQNYVVPLATTPHRWLSEQILGENPFMIRQVPVSTSAVQDMSEKSYSASRSSK